MADAREMVDADAVGETVADPMVAVYRHDVHKMNGRRHGSGAEVYHGVPVNEAVPRGADSDAALLSRPSGEPEQMVANHSSPYRLSLLTGESATESDRIEAAADGGFRSLVVSDDAHRLHATWLTSDVAAAFNESVYYPYTSLKYHVLLTAALLSEYRTGRTFDELYLAVHPGESSAADAGVEAALESDVVSPHRTVLWSPLVTLAVTSDPGDRPAARLGPEPARSFADVWSRLSQEPFDVDEAREWMVLDAQLRRLRSWSTALQYIEEFVAWRGMPDAGAADVNRGWP
ncbi:hypothetical protein [Haloarcula japonica]|uniref:DUF8168 domain-containing protein n=1 Tax=Haloarcula japonica (strain ATCC 49778 / DSM 6131 / JCM 7785 / NBRC 101032 / NCIMB 13157 / TR-1) TaxID=1227453 RepID=M0L9D3_HALJT|nr:hypothetical protein [Haloarcula japonica]EMA29079.1 hypothetical protein C444_16983 [Haloarcula japonica DSM 6131]